MSTGPSPSPKPPDELPDSPSGIYRWVNGRLVNVLELADLEAASARAKLTQALTIQNVAWFIGVIAAVVVSLFVGYGKVMAAAREEAQDAGKDIAHDVKLLKVDQAQIEKKVDRIDAQLELVLDKLKVKQSDRPPAVPEKDGGR